MRLHLKRLLLRPLCLQKCLYWRMLLNSFVHLISLCMISSQMRDTRNCSLSCYTLWELEAIYSLKCVFATLEKTVGLCEFWFSSFTPGSNFCVFTHAQFQSKFDKFSSRRNHWKLYFEGWICQYWHYLQPSLFWSRSIVLSGNLFNQMNVMAKCQLNFTWFLGVSI